MAVLVVNMSYPTEQAEAATKRFQEMMPKFPPQPDVTMRGPYWSGDIEKGIKGLSIVEVEGSKINQARSRLAAFCNACHGIPGLKWSIEIWAEQADLQERREKYGY